MLQKNSYATVCDSCGAWSARIFHIYRGFRHKAAFASNFVKISVRQTAPTSVIRRGRKSKALVIRTRFKSNRVDGSYVRFEDNSIILLKKRLTPRGKELIGPLTYGLHRRRVIASFSGIA